MNRRQCLSSLACSLAVPVSDLVAQESGSKKKGWAGGDANLHRSFGANWYYTWSPKTRPSWAAEFVPMIKGSWSLKQKPALLQMKGVSYLLGFNEPERKKQGNISVKDALNLWPQLVQIAEKKNLRLGSPAPSSDGPGLAWLDAFMKEAKSRKLRVDFLAVHWYRSRKADEFESYLKNMDRSYRLPIWVTEFNGWTGPEEEHYSFLKDSLRFLEKSKSVERYAYFNPGKGKPHSLIRQDGEMTRLGKLYRDA